MFFTYHKTPVKVVRNPAGGLAAWRLVIDTGGWESVDRLLDRLRYGLGEVDDISQERFVQDVERSRARHLTGDGPVYAWYGTVRAVIETAMAERRSLTVEEGLFVQGILRRTFVMFEEQLRRAGDPGADPSLVA